MLLLRKLLPRGDPDAVLDAIQRGADVHYRDENGYDALINAVHGRDVARDSRLLNLLQLLIEQGVALSNITSYGESALRVLSQLGRFDGVRLLLDAGADETHLGWTPLMNAVALGDLDDVKAALAHTPNVEERDFWERTALLIALTSGDVNKAQLLVESGASLAARGRCGAPPLFHAIRGHSSDMVRWLLLRGADVHERDDLGSTALIEAVELDDIGCVEILLQAGADVHVNNNGTAAERATSRAMCFLLLKAGADPADINQRVLLGLLSEDRHALESVTNAEYFKARTQKFGRRNPEMMQEPFWEAMIRAGVCAYAARKRFEGDDGSTNDAPTWCAARFGQSLTTLPDGRVVQIAGEHEDHYDPDFCIYNDVFVHHLDGNITIYGYPEEVFPPTDFHTATFVDDCIYIIGSLGYHGTRRHGFTPVYRLNTTTFAIESVPTTGTSPGWIYKHRAELVSDHVICVWGGTIETDLTVGNGIENDQRFNLDLRRMIWSK